MRRWNDMKTFEIDMVKYVVKKENRGKQSEPHEKEKDGSVFYIESLKVMSATEWTHETTKSLIWRMNQSNRDSLCICCAKKKPRKKNYSA